MYFQTKSKEKTFMGLSNINLLSNVRSGQNLNRRSIPRNNLFLPEIIDLRTVPTIVIAHTFCASPDTRISYCQCLLIEGYFCAV